MGRVINLLNSPIIGKKSSFAFVSLLTGLGIKYNTKKISAFFTILPTTFYLLITGMQISAQRAYIMVILVLVAIIIERKYRGLIAIAFAASVILIVEPEAILKPGFQMSFSAVLALVASYQINANKLFKIKIIKYFVSIMISSVIASLATVPYTIYNFNYFSISGIITNLIAIPIVTLIIIPLGIIYVLLIPLGIEWIIAPFIERPIDSISIILEFPTSIGKLNVILYHDVKKYDQVQLRVENKEMWAELQKRGEEIGKNCLFGGVKLKEAVERGSFTRCGIWNEKYAIKEISNDEVLSSWVNRVCGGSKETFREL